MCNSNYVSAAFTQVAGAVTAYGQREAGRYNAAVAETNAALADMSAQDALARGTAEESRYRMNIRQLQGRQRAAIGSSGIERSGTALQALTDTAAIGELDLLTIRNNAAREAFGYRTQGLNYRAQARLDRFSGRVGSFATILGTEAQVAQQVGAGITGSFGG